MQKSILVDGCLAQCPAKPDHITVINAISQIAMVFFGDHRGCL